MGNLCDTNQHNRGGINQNQIKLQRKITKPQSQILNSIEPDSFNDRAYGCILGAFIGDACGSYNEFETQIQDAAFMAKCMEMPGGGPHKLGPG